MSSKNTIYEVFYNNTDITVTLLGKRLKIILDKKSNEPMLVGIAVRAEILLLI